MEKRYKKSNSSEKNFKNLNWSHLKSVHTNVVKINKYKNYGYGSLW